MLSKSGQDTTASAITWMVKFLDENQEVLETLRVSEKKSGGRGCEFKTNKCFCNLPIKKKKKNVGEGFGSCTQCSSTLDVSMWHGYDMCPKIIMCHFYVRSNTLKHWNETYAKIVHIHLCKQRVRIFFRWFSFFCFLFNSA